MRYLLGANSLEIQPFLSTLIHQSHIADDKRYPWYLIPDNFTKGDSSCIRKLHICLVKLIISRVNVFHINNKNTMTRKPLTTIPIVSVSIYFATHFW